MTIKELRKKYNNFEEGVIGSNGYQSIIEPFDLTPKKYLEFAEVDLAQKEKTARPALNALSNIKRAADCQVDTLLMCWGLFDHAKKERFRFYDKIELIKRIGILAPGLLTRINTYRNSAEHDYKAPDIEKIKDYHDMVSIFVEYSNKYLKYDINGSEILCDADIDTGDWLNIGFDRDAGEFNVEYVHDVTEDASGKRSSKTTELKYTVESNTEDYVELLNIWYSLTV